MRKAKVHRTKPGRVDYDDLDVIKRMGDACEAVRTGEMNLFKASKAYDIP